MLNGPFSPWPSFTQEEADAVQRVLLSNNVNYWNGDEGRAFEREFADFHGVAHAVAVANGSLALELALHALGIGEGDEVVVTPRTFIASASSIVLCGAVPVFADVDPVSQNITPETVRPVLTEHTRAIITVHLAGWPCDMLGFLALARKHDLKIIEDCAQAHGAMIGNQHVGSFGDAAAFSFCTDKIMTTGGEGGMLLLKDEAAWRRAWAYKDHGKDWGAVYNTQHAMGFRWLHESFGSNWRLTEMQSAIGRIQLQKLPVWVEQRRANAAVLHQALSEQAALRLTTPDDNIRHAYYKYYAFVRPERLREDWNRDRIVQAIQAQGVPCMQGSCPEVYLEKAFDGTGYCPTERLPNAKVLGGTSLMFPVHPTLSEADMHFMAERILEVLRQATSS